MTGNEMVKLERRTNWMSGWKTYDLTLVEAIRKMSKYGYTARKRMTRRDGKLVVSYEKIGCATEYLMIIDL